MNCLRDWMKAVITNTISISQLGSVTDKELENILKNYAANLGPQSLWKLI